MQISRPRSAEELSQLLVQASAGKQTVHLGGSFSKNGMAGPLPDQPGVVISTSGMNRILNYEPRDLTISVEAGMRWSDLVADLARNQQMIPLDPPFFSSATVGGVIAANTCGPRRRLYGSVRDVVIGMKFVPVDGRLIQTGGMVVKNVAGLDMGKLMIGSFGTLAAIVSVNFKLAPTPPVSRTFLLQFPTLADAIRMRDSILQGVLQPASLDLLNPKAAARLGLDGFCLLLQAGGSDALISRYTRELADAAILEGEAESDLWKRIREFTPAFLIDHPEGTVLRIPATLAGVSEVIEKLEGPAVCRAGNGVTYAYFERTGSARLPNNTKGAIEFAPESQKRQLDLWPSPGSGLAIMEKIKALFDPNRLLNPGRMYGRI